MTFEEFVARIETDTSIQGEGDARYIEVTWTAGGITGGSCYGGESRYPIAGEPEPEWDALDELLTDLCPGITFLKYKKLMALSETGTREDGGDYYGNYGIDGYRQLTLRNIYNFLTENKLLKDG